MGLKETFSNFVLECQFSSLCNRGWSVNGSWSSDNKPFLEVVGFGNKYGDLLDQAINRVANRDSGIESVRIVLSKGVEYKTLVVRGSNS